MLLCNLERAPVQDSIRDHPQRDLELDHRRFPAIGSLV